MSLSKTTVCPTRVERDETRNGISVSPMMSAAFQLSHTVVPTYAVSRLFFVLASFLRSARGYLKERDGFSLFRSTIIPIVQVDRSFKMKWQRHPTSIGQEIILLIRMCKLFFFFFHFISLARLGEREKKSDRGAKEKKGQDREKHFVDEIPVERRPPPARMQISSRFSGFLPRRRSKYRKCRAVQARHEEKEARYERAGASALLLLHSYGLCNPRTVLTPAIVSEERIRFPKSRDIRNLAAHRSASRLLALSPRIFSPLF